MSGDRATARKPVAPPASSRFPSSVRSAGPTRWATGAVKREELPAIDAKAAQELVDDAVELLIVEHGFRLKEKPAKPNGGAGAGGDAWAFLDDAIDHDSLTAGAMTLLRAGMHDGAVVNLLRALVTNLHDVDEDRRDRRFDEIPDMVWSARAKLGAPPKGPRRQKSKTQALMMG